jgi:hypothetical protein
MNMLSSTWTFKYNRYPDGLINNSVKVFFVLDFYCSRTI